MNAGLTIEISGNKFSLNSGSRGLTVTASGCTIQGLVINRFQEEVVLNKSASGKIQGCYLGTDPTGSFVPVNAINNHLGFHGVNAADAPNNLIGGTSASMRNLISGHGANIAVGSNGNTADGNIVQGNIIGLKAEGSADISDAETEYGIYLDGGNFTVIGGAAGGTRNVISGNGLPGGGGGAGIAVGPGNNNIIQGNYIGTDVTGNRRDRQRDRRRSARAE